MINQLTRDFECDLLALDHGVRRPVAIARWQRRDIRTRSRCAWFRPTRRTARQASVRANWFVCLLGISSSGFGILISAISGAPNVRLHGRQISASPGKTQNVCGGRSIEKGKSLQREKWRDGSARGRATPSTVSACLTGRTRGGKAPAREAGDGSGRARKRQTWLHSRGS